jgi:hypothetical protein
MNQILTGLGNHPSQHLARRQIESRINVQRLFAAIDADPGIVGAGVVYIDADYNVVTLREFTPICSIQPKRLILREAKRYIAPAQFVQEVQDNPRESRLLKEAIGTTLSCTGAILGWIVVFSGTVAVPFTAGASMVVAGIGVAAASASTAQCFVGGIRTYSEVQNPSFNDAMDNDEWYQSLMPVLDALSLLGVGTSGLTTFRFLKARKAATGRSWYETSRGLSRQQRKALTDELLSLRYPELTGKLLRLKQASGALPKRYSSTQIQHATLTQIKDAVGGFIGLVGSSKVQSLAIGLYEELAP